MLSLATSRIAARPVACRAAATVEPVIAVKSQGSCCSAVDVVAAKDKCVHPTRPL
eukprot:CAMPEP_0202857060 /NCGR_PEP_ID=MMETSP1391-20130828/148_1 /ASSEMBLY_ACC=CAM_ASM_000867 /TAXON_ID=1034604 /ORGANISM="Chlamydomonas leiostraca, Strain SAG 11-49" /LENGTH=54 /DNA_ID=CAMNT_0049535817 /DNA_START=83 /DNA_END=244 /DNA_ORIENTATION=+